MIKLYAKDDSHGIITTAINVKDLFSLLTTAVLHYMRDVEFDHENDGQWLVVHRNIEGWMFEAFQIAQKLSGYKAENVTVTAQYSSGVFGILWQEDLIKTINNMPGTEEERR